MSGVWERLGQTTKKHLKNVVGDGLLNDLELRTLLAEIESIVNNRPITVVSDDPADFAALTPNHFLLQRATQLPPGVFVSEDKFSRRRWRKVQFLWIIIGRDGYESICWLSKEDQNVSNREEMCGLAT